MLVAINNEREFVEANRTLCRKESYHCPSCKNPVHLKTGAVMRAHFAHYQHTACDTFSEGETAEHMKGKLALKSWLESLDYEVELEAYLPELQQRPDLLLTIEKQKIALEFQCSAIPIQKLVERTVGYQSKGYKVIWILGEQFTYKKKLTTFQKSCLTKLDEELILFHYSVSKELLEYRYHFKLKQNREMSCVKRSIKYGKRIFLHFNRPKYEKEISITIEIEHHKLLRQLAYSAHKNKIFLNYLYQQQETLVSIPKEIYAVMPSEWLLQNHSYKWKLAFVLWIEEFPLQTVLTKKKLQNFLNTFLYHAIPQITVEMQYQPLLEFIAYLTEAGVLKQIRLDKWQVVQYSKRFKYLEEKFK